MHHCVSSLDQSGEQGANEDVQNVDRIYALWEYVYPKSVWLLPPLTYADMRFRYMLGSGV